MDAHTETFLFQKSVLFHVQSKAVALPSGIQSLAFEPFDRVTHQINKLIGRAYNFVWDTSLRVSRHARFVAFKCYFNRCILITGR